jgi:valyl-tRNA synthetase
MTGSNVEWIPGFDHAGIATHSVVQRKLALSSRSPTELQTEINNFSKLNRESITDQLKLLGALLDWEKTYYTLDEASKLFTRKSRLFNYPSFFLGAEIFRGCSGSLYSSVREWDNLS